MVVLLMPTTVRLMMVVNFQHTTGRRISDGSDYVVNSNDDGAIYKRNINSNNGEDNNSDYIENENNNSNDSNSN